MDKDRIEGSARELKGKIKETIGKATGDAKMRGEGAAEKVAGKVQNAISALMATLLERAEEHLDWAMPGYTHLQRAQPVYLSHHLLAYFWMLQRDRERFAFAEAQTSSLPLGAGRLTREWLNDDPPGRRRVGMLRDWLDAELADAAAQMLDAGSPDLAVATSKTFRSLARLTGAAPSAAGPRVKRTLTANGLRQLISFISRMTTADRAELEGVSAERAPQIVAGALVAEASMRALSIETVDICPWALREGLILRKLDSEADGTAFVETSVRDAGNQRVNRNGGKK